ncbi:hypothetical protein [Pseudomonas fildesensis]|uniref:Uncharacterized protein n=1 Tax=Pseudomonas fildesensis TaxID=1674920 RepID=A0A0J8FQ79_9PSED|nr:hypothetical protein [Pseudomonas fildesensis]KMT52402.1 hypothetical protein ACR52_28125 [Pseudomonas fildesensis]
MNNNYRFEKLKKLELGPNENKEDIYSLMLRPTLSGNIIQVFDSLAELKPNLSSDYYYIAHNLVTRKGKKIFFKGDLYKAKIHDLLNFLDEAINSDDLRELLISPVEANSTRKVFYCSEDAFYMYAAEDN